MGRDADQICEISIGDVVDLKRAICVHNTHNSTQAAREAVELLGRDYVVGKFLDNSENENDDKKNASHVTILESHAELAIQITVFARSRHIEE